VSKYRAMLPGTLMSFAVLVMWRSSGWRWWLASQLRAVSRSSPAKMRIAASATPKERLGADRDLGSRDGVRQAVERRP
jgi:hypothetical protein